jgi:hypothetical protein
MPRKTEPDGSESVPVPGPATLAAKAGVGLRRGQEPILRCVRGPMSNTDSFIDEVTEEVRRDRLFALLRRWAWLMVAIVLGIVGAAAWLEYSRAQDRAAAQAFGDALVLALDGADAESRITALAAMDAARPEGRVLLALMAASEAVAGGMGADEAAADLRAAAEGPDLPPRYRDLAMLKAEMIAPSSPEQGRLILGALAEPGAPYAALAEEQLALIDIRAGDLDAALARLRSLQRSAAATPGLQDRASQLIVALEAGSTLIDTAPTRPPMGAPAPIDPASPAQGGPAATDGATGGGDTAADPGPAVQQ